MNRKFLTMLGALSVAALVVCGIGVASPARAQMTPAPGWFGGSAAAPTPAANVPKTWSSNGVVGVLTPDTHHSCGGDDILYVFPDGSGRCFQSPPPPPPRSQADCKNDTRFAIMHGNEPSCVGGANVPFLNGHGPLRMPCTRDADCAKYHNQLCSVNGYCQSRTAGQ